MATKQIFNLVWSQFLFTYAVNLLFDTGLRELSPLGQLMDFGGLGAVEVWTVWPVGR